MDISKIKPAIPQERYVKITSTNVNDSEVADRDFGGLVFTTTKKFYKYDEATGEPTEENFLTDSLLECFSSDQVGRCFGTSSPEYKFALEYFSYMSPSGRGPTKLSFAHILGGEETGGPEDPVAAIERVNKGSNNFGSFCYLQGGTYTVGQMKDVITKNTGYNYKYLFSLAFPKASQSTGPIEDESTQVSATTADAFQSYLAGEADIPTFTGYVLSVGNDKDPYEENADFNNAAMMPMTIFASTDYNRPNSATFFMFKQFPTQLATVTDEDAADLYDGKCVNYVGLVQVNGRRRSFYQRGVNGNGESTSVYCNEVWLKSRIATDIIDLMVSVERIPANEDGELVIRNIICADAEFAITNGVIERNKTLTEDQKRKVYNLTQDNEAYRQIEQSGYYIEVEIKKGTKFNTDEYTAVYRLIYAKGDAICAVEGTHLLV